MSFGGGGDGGAGARSAASQAERNAAIGKINQYFGIEDLTPRPAPGAPSAWRPGPPGTTWQQSSFLPASRPVAPASDPTALANRAAREKLYGTTRQDVINLGTRDLTEQTQKAQRGLDFALARKGLAGGSAGVDLNQELQSDAAKGATNIYRSGVAAENQFRTADETARQNAIATILGGADAGTALQGATNSLAQNARDIAGRDYGGAAGEAFSSLGDIIGSRAQANAAAAAAKRYSAALPQPAPTYGRVTN